MKKINKFGFIGSGNMAEALIKGLIKSKIAKSSQIHASDINIERLHYISKVYKIDTSKDNVEIVKKCNNIIFAVKPQNLEHAVDGLSKYIDKGKLIISILAGIKVEKIQSLIGKNVKVIRAMPNTPALMLEGITAIFAGSGVDKTDIDTALNIFNSVGKTVLINNESFMDAITGLSGSGPAYYFYIAESLSEAGQALGLPRDISEKLAYQTMLGSAKLILESGKTTQELIKQVSSPGGTTIEGLKVIENEGLRLILKKAVESAAIRAKELSK